jgi:hypothetical protein
MFLFLTAINAAINRNVVMPLIVEYIGGRKIGS